MTTVLVCGSRKFRNSWQIYKELDKIHKKKEITKIVNGGAGGADEISRRWSHRNQIPYVVYPAQWNKHGKAAGTIRNQQMLDEEVPNIVLAFYSGKRSACRGTSNMVMAAIDFGVEELLEFDENIGN